MFGGIVGRCFLLHPKWKAYQETTGLRTEMQRLFLSRPFFLPAYFFIMIVLACVVYKLLLSPRLRFGLEVIPFIVTLIVIHITRRALSKLYNQYVIGIVASVVLFPFQKLAKLDLVGKSYQDYISVIELFGFCILASAVGEDLFICVFNQFKKNCQLRVVLSRNGTEVVVKGINPT
jgi:hypothetical protein